MDIILSSSLQGRDRARKKNIIKFKWHILDLLVVDMLNIHGKWLSGVYFNLKFSLQYNFNKKVYSRIWQEPADCI